eukprot:3389400-Rhodomonas_salina.1
MSKAFLIPNPTTRIRSKFKFCAWPGPDSEPDGNPGRRLPVVTVEMESRESSPRRELETCQ